MLLRRNITTLLMALALIAALPVQGWAQGVMARVADAVVVCIGDREGTLVLDIHGAEVTLLPGCPDCLPTHALAASGPAVAAPEQAVFASDFAERAPIGQPGPATLSTWPRAPPV